MSKLPPPGKARKRSAPVKIPSSRSGSAPVFRIFGILLLLPGLLATGMGISAWVASADFNLVTIGAICLFWSAMMFALAEALEHLADIAASSRNTANRSVEP